MNYELKFDDNGNMNGHQIVRWELSDKRFGFSEYQFFVEGKYCDGFVVIVDRKDMTSYVVRSEDWGTMDYVRDAAERFAMGSIKVAISSSISGMTKFILPFTEEAFV